jgi:hypothetical protein
MVRVDEFVNARGYQTHSVLMNFNFFGHADFHKVAPQGKPGWQGYSPKRRETIGMERH